MSYNTSRTVRWIRFFIAIAIGMGLGLFYGWVINPIEFTDTAPSSLSIDYKADYVLMVAEAYQADRDLLRARERLAPLGGASPSQIVLQAILSAEPHYVERDLEIMRQLQSDLQAQEQGLESPGL
ncbi:MAG: hypothetical protein GX495_10770 [Chloroflexi bacterium]|jgi:hypothetical protein|nr:hypothetical protein [Chloroflexota bacterium]